MDDVEDSRNVSPCFAQPVYIHTLDVGRLVTYLRPLMIANLRANLKETRHKIWLSVLSFASYDRWQSLSQACSIPEYRQIQNAWPYYTSLWKPRESPRLVKWQVSIIMA